MGCLWPMTRFAVHMRMPSAHFLLDDFRVTVFAGLVTGELYRTSLNLRDRAGAVMPVLAETTRDKKAASDQEDENAKNKNHGHAKQMPGILEVAHKVVARS